MAKTAADLGISDWCLGAWIARAAIDAGERAGVSTDDGRELVELRRRNQVLETENEILKRAGGLLRGGERPPKMI